MQMVTEIRIKEQTSIFSQILWKSRWHILVNFIFISFEKITFYAVSHTQPVTRKVELLVDFFTRFTDEKTPTKQLLSSKFQCTK